MNASTPPRAATKRPLVLALFFLGMAAVCVLVTLLSLRLFEPTRWAHDEPEGHAWLHEQLDLNAEEMARIDALEPAYRAERRRLQAELDARIQGIAGQLQQHDSLAPEVTAAIHELHAVHSQLQELAIQHYFDMLGALPPDKQRKLRALAAEALSAPPQ